MKIYIDEPNATKEQLDYFEHLSGLQLPASYRSFLMQYNGCVAYPALPTIESDDTMELCWVERFLSIGDLILQIQSKDLMYVYKDCMKSNDAETYPIDIDKLITIAFDSHGGTYHLYLGEEDFGQFYWVNYSGLGVFTRLKCNSIFGFVESFKNYPDEPNNFSYYDEVYSKSSKIFDYSLFSTKDNLLLGLERFKEVLKLYGNPNKTHPFTHKNVMQQYADNPLFLEYLVSQGGSTEGLLNYVQGIEAILYLIEKCNQNINMLYEGRYPLFTLINTNSMAASERTYKLMDKMLFLGYEFDCNITDNNGRNIKERLKEAREGYKAYIDYQIQKYPNRKIDIFEAKNIENFLKNA